MYLYHYHAIKQLAVGSVINMDGLIKREAPLSGDWDEYRKLKDEIEGANGEQVTGKLTICSLTLLSSQQEGE
jgi:hypothetical protein